MLITLSRRTAICQSVAEVELTGVTPLRAVSHRFNFIIIIRIYTAKSRLSIHKRQKMSIFYYIIFRVSASQEVCYLVLP